MKRIVRLTESDLTRIVKRVISETNFFRRTFLGEPSKDDIEYAMQEIKNSNDNDLINVFKNLYDAYINKSETTVMYNGEEANLSFSEAKELFFKIVKGISNNGIDSLEIGIKLNFPDNEKNIMYVRSEKPYRWGDHMYDDEA